jgi:hypothetical protein
MELVSWLAISLVYGDSDLVPRITPTLSDSYRLDDRGSRVRFPAGAGNFSLHTMSRTALGPTQSPIQWVLGVLSLGVKQQGHEADHSSPSSAEVKE